MTEPRLDAEATAQQVTAVERGYNLYQANCARCHGANGEGGIGPVLNGQEKLFAHLNAQYLRNVLTAGGRYVCGNPNSLMPVWSNTANPPGPLNYRQIDDLIAFIRATNERDLHRSATRSSFEPEVDPIDRQGQDVHGLGRPELQAGRRARRRSRPAGPTRSRRRRLARGRPARPAASALVRRRPASAPAGTVVARSPPRASRSTTTDADRPGRHGLRDRASTTRTPASPHNVAIKDADRRRRSSRARSSPASRRRPTTSRRSRPGTYTFVCTVHPNMTGTLTVK